MLTEPLNELSQQAGGLNNWKLAPGDGRRQFRGAKLRNVRHEADSAIRGAAHLTEKSKKV